MNKTEQLKKYEEQLTDYAKELKEAESSLKKKEQEIVQYANQVYGSQGKQNLVEWELDFKPELDDIARSLRCDILIVDEHGNQFWSPNQDKTKVFLNELGVNDVLRKIILLVNKNKVLSNFTDEEIKRRVRMIGHEIRALIYNNYETYGIDNEYKMNNYPSIVMDVLDVVDSAYRRAIKGETHKGLNEQRIVTQSDTLNREQGLPQKQTKPHWYNPKTWGN